MHEWIWQFDIDGIAYPSIDMYAPLQANRSEKLIALGLAPSEHVLTVTVSEERNPLSSKGAIVVDAVSVGGGLTAGQNQIIGSIVSWPPSPPEHEGSSSDRVLLVPSGYSTIQGAIEAANNGDTIIVAPGTYREDLDFLGKIITLRSQNPDDDETVESTILEAKESPSTVRLVRGETRETTLAGFTIRNRLGGKGMGRGIYISSSSPTIAQNIISDCTGGGIVINEADSPLITGNTIKNIITDMGCGIQLYLSSPMIIGNIITDNEAVGISTWFSSPTIVDNTITNNTGSTGGFFIDHYSQPILRHNLISGNIATGHGGGIYLDDFCHAIIDRNIIIDNKASHGAGITMILDCRPVITNNVIANNTGGAIFTNSSYPEVINNTIADNLKEEGKEWTLSVHAMGNSRVYITNSIIVNSDVLIYDEFSKVVVNYSLISGCRGFPWQGENNISTPPLFVGNGDYHLLPNSPAIDTGTTVDLETDLDGNKRPQGQGFDIGAYEYVTQD